MGRINNEKELIRALQAQLIFRKNILKQKHKDIKIFNLSKKKKKSQMVNMKNFQCRT